MEAGVVHGWENETLEAKVAWFRTLSVAERLAVLDEYYRLAVALCPKLREGRDVEPSETPVRILALRES